LLTTTAFQRKPRSAPVNTHKECAKPSKPKPCHQNFIVVACFCLVPRRDRHQGKRSFHIPDPTMTSNLTPWRAMLACAVLALASLPGMPLRADDNQTPACVTVEVNGNKALPYDCYQRNMTPSATPERGTPAMDSATVAGQAPNRLGLFNLSTLRNRMGNTLGQGVRPQRPPAPPPLP
jgi:hypothetical protein